MREIMTLQLGGYSCFTGSHYWNIQDEAMSYEEETGSDVVSSVLFRSGQTEHSMETYVPRLMLLDTKGARGSLKRTGYLYGRDDEETQAPGVAGGGSHATDLVPGAATGAQTLGVGVTTWTGAVQRFDTEPVNVHPFQQRMLDAQEEEEEWEEEEGDGVERGEDGVRNGDDTGGEGGLEGDGGEGEAQQGVGKKNQEEIVVPDQTVKYWSDFLKVHLHPRSCHDLAFPSQPSHQVYAFGRQTREHNRDLMDEWEDNIHWWLEECDTLQGFQVMVDADSTFGYFAGEMCRILSDDYPRTPIVVMGVMPEREMEEEEEERYTRLQRSDEAMTAFSLMEHASLYIPLRPSWGPSSVFSPHLNPNPASWFRSSAIIASSLDTCFITPRLSSPTLMMHWSQQVSNSCSQKFCGMRSWLPLVTPPKSSFASILSNRGPPLNVSPIQEAVTKERASGWTGMGSEIRAPTEAPEQQRLTVFSQSVVARGFREAVGRSQGNEREELRQSFQNDYRCSQTSEQCLDFALPLPVSFPPKLFSQHIQRNGICLPGVSGKPQEPARVPHIAALQATTGLCPWMAGMTQAIWKGVNQSPADAHLYSQGDIGADERREAAEGLGELLAGYKEAAGVSDDDSDNGDDWDD